MFVFCQWKELWWKEQIPHHKGLSAQLTEGLRAHTKEQANLECHICLSWTNKWSRVCQLTEHITVPTMGMVAASGQEVVEAPDQIELDLEDELNSHAGDSDFEE